MKMPITQHGSATHAPTEADIASHSDAMLALFQDLLRSPSVSGHEAASVHLLADWAGAYGFVTDLWEADESHIAHKFGPLGRHIPLANRPSLHISLPGNPARPSMLFNGHSDVVAAGDETHWRFGPWTGEIENGTIYGRGACDVKGPIVAALWAMLAIKHTVPPEMRAPLAIEIVPGEEDCVGLGTLASIARGHSSDAVIVLEPTENQPRCASRAGYRFEITATGRAVHGTVKWLGADAIDLIHHVLTALKNIEQRWNDRSADPLFSSYPIARPITVDRIEGNGWQGMICDRCSCAGYLELLPSDNMEAWKANLWAELQKELRHLGQDPTRLQISFCEEYRGHMTPIDHPFCALAQHCVEKSNEIGHWEGWRGFNSGCEAGVRANLLKTPTLVWGPGTLEHAHSVDERIEWRDVQLAARRFADFALAWGQNGEGAC